VLSWGKGEDGQLGHGGAHELAAPRVVAALRGRRFKAVCCGAEYSMAVEAGEDEVYSWGWGDFGRLGHGNSDDLFLPRRVRALSGVPVRAVACGDTHTMIVTQADALLCCGRNQNGQLGLGHNEDVRVPAAVEALAGVRVRGVACGAEHTVACSADGRAFAWGWGRYGNLGLGSCEDRNVPCQVQGVRDVSQVCCGWRHSVCIAGEGEVFVFGWNKYGQLGTGDNEHRLTPVRLQALAGVQSASGGWRHTMAIGPRGQLFAWGWNQFGQLGLGSKADVNSPQEVKLLAGQPVASVVCGWRHTMCLSEAGDVFSWGRGSNGQLGHNLCVDSTEPQRLDMLCQGELEVGKLQDGASARGAKDYISPAERYAVVPEGAQGGGGEMDDVPGVPEAKKRRVV